MKITYGWSLMLVVVFCVLYFRYLDAKSDGRLDRRYRPALDEARRRRARCDAVDLTGRFRLVADIASVDA